MSGHKFELEQVLGYRREMEKLRKQDFVSAKIDLEQACDCLKEQEQYIDTLAKEFCNRQSELASIEEIRMYSDFFARKREDIKNQKEQIEYLDTVLSDRREELLDATKDKKVLESLKERKAREFKLALLQKERAFLDEISIQKKGL